jgi:polygalacturonase
MMRSAGPVGRAGDPAPVPVASVPVPVASGGRLWDVRDFGAVGDGLALDSDAINRAVEACAAKGGGQVRFPPGRYLSGTVQLRSRVALHLEAGARLVGTTNLAEYRQPTPPAFLPEARWGKWHRALLLGEDVERSRSAAPA